MKLTTEQYQKLSKKLEYRFKNSNDPLVEKINKEDDLSKEDISLLLKKLEYGFKKKGDPIITTLQESIA